MKHIVFTVTEIVPGTRLDDSGETIATKVIYLEHSPYGGAPSTMQIATVDPEFDGLKKYGVVDLVLGEDPETQP